MHYIYTCKYSIYCTFFFLYCIFILCLLLCIVLLVCSWLDRASVLNFVPPHVHACCVGMTIKNPLSLLSPLIFNFFFHSQNHTVHWAVVIYVSSNIKRCWDLQSVLVAPLFCVKNTVMGVLKHSCKFWYEFMQMNYIVFRFFWQIKKQPNYFYEPRACQVWTSVLIKGP